MSVDTSHVDLLRLIGADTPLRYKTRTSRRGVEYAGPCPFCGGTDRLCVQPEVGKWWCRRCSPDEHWADAVAYVMQRDGCTFPEALAKLDAMPPAPPYQPPKQVDEPAPPSLLNVAWVCHRTLLASPKPLAWLEARGIDAAAVERHNLGYVPAEGAIDRELPDGNHIGYLQQEIDGHWVAAGITIPLRGVDGSLHGIKVRRAGGKPKYVQVKGSQMPLFGVAHAHGTCIVVEGEFDCLLLARFAADLVDVLTIGHSTAVLPDRWAKYLATYRHILVCLDADTAGEQGVASWLTIPKARRISLPPIAAVPEGSRPPKDVTDYWRDYGLDLHAWVEEQLAELATSATPTPQSEAAAFWTQAATDVREMRAALEPPRIKAPEPKPEIDIWIDAIPGRPDAVLLRARDGSSRVMVLPAAEGG